MSEAAGAGGGMAGAGLTAVLWPLTLCSSRRCAPPLSGSPLWDRMGAAVEPPHQAPGHSPPRSELRGHQGAQVHAPPLQGWVRTLQAAAWSPHLGPKMGSGDERCSFQYNQYCHSCGIVFC